MMRHISLLILTFLPTVIFGQINISPSMGEQESSLTGRWKLSIQNTMTVPVEVFLRISIYNDRKQLVYEARSSLFEVLPGEKPYNHGQFLPIQLSISQLNPENPKQGSYSLQYTLFQVGDFKVMGEQQIQVAINRATDVSPDKSRPNTSVQHDVTGQSAKSKKSERKKLIRVQGDGMISAQYANRQGTNSEVPEKYLRAELFPVLELGIVPIGANIFFSTEEDISRQEMNQVSLRFDAATFRRNLQNSVQKHIGKLQQSALPANRLQAEAFRTKMLKKQFPKLEKWREELEDPNLQKQLNELKQLDGLGELLMNPEFDKGRKDLKKLEQETGVRSYNELITKGNQLDEEKYLQLFRLYSLMAQHKELQAKHKQLQAKGKRLRSLRKKAEKLKQAEQISNRSLLSDPANLRQGLKLFDMNKGAVPFLSSFNALEIGSSYPYYSRLTLNGISVKGVHAELNPGPFYLVGTYGNTLRQTLDTTGILPRFVFPQRMLGLRAGFGKMYGTHIYFTYLDFEDDSSAPFQDSLSGTLKNPASNQVLGTDIQIAAFGRKLVLGAEANGSLFTRNKLSGELPIDAGSIPLSKFFERKINGSTASDYAYRGFFEINLNRRKTQVSGFLSRVGPGYRSLGAPTLIPDLLRYRAEFRQTLFKGSVQATLYGSRDQNRLDPLIGTFQSTTTSYGASLYIRIPKMPFLILTYAPYYQENFNAITDANIGNTSQMINTVAGYQYSFSRQVKGMTQLGFTHMMFRSDLPMTGNSTYVYTFTQSLIAGRMANFSFSGTYMPKHRIGADTREIKTLDFSGSFTFFKTWRNRVGYRMVKQTGIDTRKGFYFVSGVPVTRVADFELRIQQNNYFTSDNSSGYDELVANVGLRLSL